MVHFILATAHILNHRCVAHSVGDSINCSLDAGVKIVISAYQRDKYTNNQFLILYGAKINH